MNNYNISGLILKEVRYNFTKPERKTLTISVNDDIEIIGLFENQATLEVKRTLYFDSKNESFVIVSYEVMVEHNEAITKDDLLEALKNRSINLVAVYSKISLLISQITNMSPLGAIVTPPSYDNGK